MRMRVGMGGIIVAAIATGASGAFTRTIMVTGYWPPTNEMLRRFSQNTTQNPQGWLGGNWENRGYNTCLFSPSSQAE